MPVDMPSVEDLEDLNHRAAVLEAKTRLALAEHRHKRIADATRRRTDATNWQPLQPTNGQHQQKRKEPTKAEAELFESTVLDSNWTQVYADYLDLFRNEAFWPMVGNMSDRRYGAYWPFYRTELELSIIRAASRVMSTVNTHAGGLLGGIAAYVVAEGFTPKCDPADGTNDPQDQALCRKVMGVLEEFNARTNFGFWQRAVCDTTFTDGGVFIHMEDHDGKLELCDIMPERVTQPPGADLEQWAFGIRCRPGNMHRPLEFSVADWLSRECSFISANDMIHQPLAIPGRFALGVKRALPLFCFGMKDTIDSAGKIATNAGEGLAIRQAFAYVRQWEQATQQQVEDFVGTTADFNTSRPYKPQETMSAQKVVPGQVEDVPAGMAFLNPPTNPESQMAVGMIDALLRSASALLNAPEWLASSNAANIGAYESASVSESPWVRRVKQLQQMFGSVFETIWNAVVRLAVKYGRLPEAALHRVKVKAVAQSPETRNKQEEASVNTSYVQMGVKSRQTVAAEQGLDFEKEFQANIDFQQKTAKAQAQMPQQPGGGEGGDAPTQQASGPMPGAQDGEPDQAGDLDPFGDVQEAIELLESVDGPTPSLLVDVLESVAELERAIEG